MGGAVVSSIDTRQLGVAILALGGGRRLISDKINPWVGLTELKRTGHKLEPGEPLVIIHAADESTADQAQRLISEAYILGEQSLTVPLFEEVT